MGSIARQSGEYIWTAALKQNVTATCNTGGNTRNTFLMLFNLQCNIIAGQVARKSALRLGQIFWCFGFVLFSPLFWLTLSYDVQTLEKNNSHDRLDWYIYPVTVFTWIPSISRHFTRLKLTLYYALNYRNGLKLSCTLGISFALLKFEPTQIFLRVVEKGFSRLGRDNDSR